MSFSSTSYYHVDTVWTYIGLSIGIPSNPLGTQIGYQGFMGNPTYGFDIAFGIHTIPNPANSFLF